MFLPVDMPYKKKSNVKIYIICVKYEERIFYLQKVKKSVFKIKYFNETYKT